MDTALIVCLALIVAALAFFIVKLVQSVREENRHDLRHHHRLIELQQESDEFFVPGDPLFPQNNDRVPRPVERIVKK